MISPPLDQLFFENDSTEYEDEGQYRCRVSHDLQDYDYHVVKTRVLELRRIGTLLQDIRTIIFVEWM